MKKNALFVLPLALLFFATTSSSLAQVTFKVLHFAKTSGFDHQTRDVSLAMFRTLGTAHNFSVDHDNTGSAFNSVEGLRQYKIVIFSNTSGNNILTAAQRANFEQYISDGGSVMGIHAASDTYRHSSANGTNRGTWDWYAELIGASVQENPNHVAGTPQYNLRKVGTHASTANLPDPWIKNEEYYYWENGYYNSANVAVLEVEQTKGPNNQVNTYDRARPMSWYRTLPTGGRSFYTALGHAPANYTSDQNFIVHIRDAVLWVVGNITGLPPDHLSVENTIRFANPAQTHLKISISALDPDPLQLFIFDLSGKAVFTKRIPSPTAAFNEDIDLSDQTPGLYLLQVLHGNRMVTRKFLLTR